MRGALGKLPGVASVDIQKGASEFTVHYDSKQVQPDALVKALIAAGETGTKVKS